LLARAGIGGTAAPLILPEINEATVRLLTRHGCEVVVARGSGCCGAIDHHLGRQGPALEAGRARVVELFRRTVDLEKAFFDAAYG